MPNLYLRQADGTPVATFKMHNDFTVRAEQEEATVLGIVPEVVSADPAEGGVTCAAIEKDVSAAYWRARAEAAEDREIQWITRTNDARAMAKLWKETAREHIGRAEVYKEWMHAAQEKAEEAERALADVHERDETVARLEVQLAKAEVITVEAIGRFRTHMWEAHDVDLDPADAVDAITAALTPEPQRPEGAEEIAALLDHMPADLIGGPLTAHEARTLADHLATHGVRVTTEQNR